jgi:transcriptional regulator with XRE-family HTH domain
MAIGAHFEDSDSDAVKPRAHRRRLFLKAAGALESGARASVLIHDLSETGLLMESATELDIKETIDLELPEAGAVRARVVWASGPLYGCSFERPLTSFELGAAQLRGAADPANAGAAPKPQGVAAIGGESFGERLNRLRKLRGMTQGDLAARLGVSKPTVWAWEQDRARPIEDRLVPLAEALGVDVAELRPRRTIAGLPELIARCREQIAEAVETTPEKVKIMIEL